MSVCLNKMRFRNRDDSIPFELRVEITLVGHFESNRKVGVTFVGHSESFRCRKVGSHFHIFFVTGAHLNIQFCCLVFRPLHLKQGGPAEKEIRFKYILKCIKTDLPGPSTNSSIIYLMFVKNTSHI